MSNVSYNELTKFVKHEIKGRTSFDFNNLVDDVYRNQISEKDDSPSPKTYYKNSIREIIWDLIIERTLTIGDYNNNEWPHLTVTERGNINLDQKGYY